MKTLKINWGAGIAAAYTGFVLMIVILVSMSTGQKIDLVTDQYYEEELKFQNKIDKRERAAALAEPLVWTIEDQLLKISFPKNLASHKIAGKIILYCPANDKNDRVIDVKAINGSQYIPLAQMPEGRFKLQIDWAADEVTYWNEGVLRIDHAAK